MQDWIGYLITFVTGLTTGVVVKTTFDFSRRKSSAISAAQDSQGVVNQSRNKVGGHMSGRDTHVSGD